MIGLAIALIGFVVWSVLEALSSLEGAFKFGRPIRIDGRPRLPKCARGRGGHDGASPRLHGVGVWRRAQLARRWLAAARAEHASVPAFEQLADRLRAHGAPAELVARCHDAAADETRHARRCFALARAYSGVDWSAGTLPAPSTEPVDLETLAHESLLDGCLGEGIAAELARQGAARAGDPVVGETLATIADDEARHAELAWAVVAFCLARGDAALGAALATAAAAAPARASRGPCDLSRVEVTAIATAQAAALRVRLATLRAAAPPQS